MAETDFNTLAGLVQFNDKNLADLDVSNLLQKAPLLEVLTTVPASNGTSHKYLVETGASSSAFREALNGITKTGSKDTLVTDTLKILDGSFDCDIALADAYKDGRDAYLQKELMRTMRQVFANVEKQIFYGVGGTGDSGGFPGLVDNTQLASIAATMVINAGGATADKQTSCFLLNHGVDNVALVLGNDGNIVVEDEPSIIQHAGADSGTYPALFVAVTGYSGFQIGGAYSAGRIANIDTNDLTSTSAFTDVHLMTALSKFPGGAGPNVICMNRNAQLLLWSSRTAVNPTGAPASTPVEFMGIPIIITDQIASTEAVET